MKWGYYHILLFILMLPCVSLGQDEAQILSREQLLWYVKNYHPVAVQANLLPAEGESTVRKARGAFDPYLYSDLEQKFFDDNTYFSILGNGLKVPTWYGIELKAGFDRNSGDFLNPQNSVPSDGLWYAGISVPLGQGLFIDKRRAALKQAKLFSEATLAEQRQLMNDLYFDAIKQYWKWVEAWNQYKIYEESVQLALTRFNAVKQNFFLGDKPAIDTLEAFIQVQNREINKNLSLLHYRNLGLKLSNFLWFENNTPLEITDNLRPPDFGDISPEDGISSEDFEVLMKDIAATHPEMQQYRYKIASMEVERQLKADKLKPKINLNYNVLNEPVNPGFLNGFSTENYKWGINFSFPLFLREQRGDLQLTKLKIRGTEAAIQQKLLELQNKVRYYYNEQVNLQSQIVLYNDAVDNYDLLLRGERRKFDIGESSLFLINSRETSLIEARVKLIELIIKYNIARTGLTWAGGKLYN